MNIPIHADLVFAQDHAYGPSNLPCTNIVIEKESKEYGACEFIMNNRRVKFRVAKITPTKNGQFVTFWKRIESGLIAPFDIGDPFDLLVISVRKEMRLGQFVFPKSVLSTKRFISQDGHGGKRAMRVYPPWDIAQSRQAQKTQLWQSHYFYEINHNKSIDRLRILQLFS